MGGRQRSRSIPDGARTGFARASSWRPSGPITSAAHSRRLASSRRKAQLFINEYGLEYDLPEERARRYLHAQAARALEEQGAPLDGLGMQGHLDLRKGRVSQPSIASFMREVEGMGLAMAVTELDVKESDYVASAQERDQLVADEVRRYLEVVLSYRNVEGVRRGA